VLQEGELESGIAKFDLSRNPRVRGLRCKFDSDADLLTGQIERKAGTS